MEMMTGVAAFVCFVGGVACWFGTLFYMFRTVALRKPGTSLWRGTGLNPFNLLLQPLKLTEAGLVTRKHCLLSAIGFIGFVLLGMAAAALSDL